MARHCRVHGGLAELAGGLGVLTGVLFRVGAACIIAVMLGAIFLVHLPHGFDVSNGGAEYAMTQLLQANGVLLRLNTIKCVPPTGEYGSVGRWRQVKASGTGLLLGLRPDIKRPSLLP
jgi:DoxX-like protein